MKLFIKINENDNVAVALHDVPEGSTENGVTALENISFGHKIALFDIKKGEKLIKYGYPIGFAAADIKSGSWVHTHNLKTGLSDIIDYSYNPKKNFIEENSTVSDRFFEGYRRKNGVGIRNEIWIIPSVGCVNKTAEILAKKATELFGDSCDGFFAFTHPYGCSQLGEDGEYTAKILAGLCRHPNTSGVLIVSLGCENNNLDVFLPFMGDYDKTRIKTLVTQEVSDELEEGMKLLSELAEIAKSEKRETLPLSELTIGLKCGASDAFSGITANPLCGAFADKFTAMGGNIILTEVPEMFGAETILMDRAKDTDTFNSVVGMINSFKQYYKRYGQVIYENPSPGNKKGGITTLEEKSLGCIQKGGNAAVAGVVNYGESLMESGLCLLSGPGNDIVSCTALASSGAHLILFTTGRGTPLGSVVPTVKISTNSALCEKKPEWIDFNAGSLLEGSDMNELCAQLLDYIIELASGKQTKNEKNGYREIAVFKDGVTL